MENKYLKSDWWKTVINVLYKTFIHIRSMKRWHKIGLLATLVIILGSLSYFIFHPMYIEGGWFLSVYDGPLKEDKPYLGLDDLIEVSELFSAAIELVQRGGNIVRTHYERNKIEQLSQSVVTQADLQSSQEIVAGFKKVWPTLRVVSEESSNLTLTPSVTNAVASPNLNRPEVDQLSSRFLALPSDLITVWIDPLDATREYIDRIPQYVTVMICIAIKGKPVIGVIHNPFTSYTSWAWTGRGRSNDLSSSAKMGRKSSPLEVTVSRSHTGKVENIVKKVFGGDDIHFISAGGSGYKALSVAKNVANLYVHSTRIRKWDICAGDAILRSLGGKMTSFVGRSIDYDKIDTPVHEGGIIASLPVNEFDHEKFLSAVQRILDLS